jgi:hypothetical protein
MGERYPDLFTSDVFTYERFEFAFDTIQVHLILHTLWSRKIDTCYINSLDIALFDV